MAITHHDGSVGFAPPLPTYGAALTYLTKHKRQISLRYWDSRPGKTANMARLKRDGAYTGASVLTHRGVLTKDANDTITLSTTWCVLDHETAEATPLGLMQWHSNGEVKFFKHDYFGHETLINRVIPPGLLYQIRSPLGPLVWVRERASQASVILRGYHAHELVVAYNGMVIGEPVWRVVRCAAWMVPSPLPGWQKALRAAGWYDMCAWWQARTQIDQGVDTSAGNHPRRGEPLAVNKGLMTDLLRNGQSEWEHMYKLHTENISSKSIWRTPVVFPHRAHANAWLLENGLVVTKHVSGITSVSEVARMRATVRKFTVPYSAGGLT